MKKWIIAVSCDPYNARFHHNDELVLDSKNGTPTAWLYGFAKLNVYDTESEAKEELFKIAKEKVYDGHHDNWCVEEDEIVEDGISIITKGEDYFRDASLTYEVTEIEESELCQEED